jgi:alkylation response protein AidB-like acyl-CoA dehydrogenase
MGVPEEFGGIKVDNVTKVLELMELSRHGAATMAVMFPLGSEIWPYHLMQETPELKAAAERAVEEGRPLFAIAITEPQAGSDDSAIATTYVRKDGKFYLNGQKTFVTDGTAADYIYTIARNPEGKGPKHAFSGFLVPQNAPGLKFAKIEKIGMWGQTLNEMFLDNVELEETALVGKEGNGFIQVMKGFETERITVSAVCQGWAQAAYEDALHYANSRIQFGQTIGSFQLIQEKLVNMKIKLENMRNLILKSAWMQDNGAKERTQPALCKLYCTTASFEVCDDAMQIFGGLGYTTDTRIHRMWTSCRFFRIGGGTDEIMIYISGRQLLKEAAKAK